MKYITQPFTLLAVLVLAFAGCDDGSDTVAPVESEESDIISFTFEQFTPTVEGTVDVAAGTVDVLFPFGTDPSAQTPTIVVSEGATINPASGVVQDFSGPVSYIVTAEDGSRSVYTVNATVDPSDPVVDTDNTIKTFDVPSLYQSGEVDNTANTVTVSVPFGSDLTNLVVELTLGEDATVAPDPSVARDYSSTQQFTVTAEDGSTRVYDVVFAVGQQETGVRGVWLTNVDSNVLDSDAAIEAAVELYADLNINTIFVVTWNKSYTTYPSDVNNDLFGKLIDPRYAGRDPIRTLIDAAHARNIKVIAWFEYGFASAFGSPGPILEAKPEWAGRDAAGNILEKNNFYWMNAYLPEVQQFMIDLMTEIVEKYPDIDGVQGDDRLPSAPIEGGYDDYTSQLYFDEFGVLPPTNQTDQQWVDFRINLVNEFALALYDSIKAVNTRTIVCSGPHPAFFGRPQYLQDYKPWVENGYCQFVSPQLYRRSDQGLAAYTGILDSELNHLSAAFHNRFFPGVLLNLGNYIMTQEYLADVIKANRERGITGEVFFFSTGLENSNVQEVLQVMYPAPAIFPDLP